MEVGVERQLEVTFAGRVAAAEDDELLVGVGGRVFDQEPGEASVAVCRGREGAAEGAKRERRVAMEGEVEVDEGGIAGLANAVEAVGIALVLSRHCSWETTHINSSISSFSRSSPSTRRPSTTP